MIKKILTLFIGCLLGISLFTLGSAVSELMKVNNNSVDSVIVRSDSIVLKDPEVIPKHEVKNSGKTDGKLPDGVEFYLPPERASPKPRIREDQIKVLPDKVVIYIKNARWATFADTNSMDPVFDAGHYGIQIVPQSPDEIQIGDVISYDSEFGSIIHRVIEIGHDEEGWFAVVKGDNNEIADPWKVRFDQVRRVLVALTY